MYIRIYTDILHLHLIINLHAHQTNYILCIKYIKNNDKLFKLIIVYIQYNNFKSLSELTENQDVM